MGKPLHSLRIPPAAASFVALDSAPGSTPLAAVQTASQSAIRPAGRRKTVQRNDGRVVRKQTIYLDADLARRLAVYCASNETDISEAVARAVESLLAG